MSSSKRALSINCGSSSIKYALFQASAEGEQLLERRTLSDVRDHAEAVRTLVSDLTDRQLQPDVVGHRVVHGGDEFSLPVRVDAETLMVLESLVPFAPLHLPTEIAAMRAVAEKWPETPQVACFDTAFHHALPELAQRYPLPAALVGRAVRRYGFHGLSYEYVVSALGGDARARTIIAHLGGGASMVALRDGRAIDTTMGFTPTGGLVMGTRPGDLDPGVLFYFLNRGSSVEKLGAILQHESGLIALSETTADMRELLALRDSDARAAFAVDAFCMSARKWIGALTAALGGIDALIFTGGVGENSPVIRAQIVQGLEHLDIAIDTEKNSLNEPGLIGAGRCEVRMIRTDEERVVARHALALALNP